MKTTLLYLNVTASGYPGAAPPEYYSPFSDRWVETYKRFNPGTSHDVVIVSCGAEPTSEVMERYKDIKCRFITYTGSGSDIGACQEAMKLICCDFVVCMSTPIYFWKEGWLKRLVDSRIDFGDGIYGPMASYQNTPHIRTSCWAVTPHTFRNFPHKIDTREKCCWAESFDRPGGGWQITSWFINKGLAARMVTWDEALEKPQWRTPPNIFRRGDQSNCIVWDQHVDVYRAAHYHERLELAKQADENSGSIS